MVYFLQLWNVFNFNIPHIRVLFVFIVIFYYVLNELLNSWGLNLRLMICNTVSPLVLTPISRNIFPSRYTCDIFVKYRILVSHDSSFNYPIYKCYLPLSKILIYDFFLYCQCIYSHKYKIYLYMYEDTFEIRLRKLWYLIT